MDSYDLPPPSYEKHPSPVNLKSSSIPPPERASPKVFKIGHNPVVPLVNSAQIKGHLALLRAFAELKSQVNELDGYAKSSLPQMPDDKERRWDWFVSLAVERNPGRFISWCIKSSGSPHGAINIKEVLPPTDVVMVWHAYMLNPGWYAEDIFRNPILQGLKRIGDVFAKSLDQLGYIVSAAALPSRVNNWTSLTSIPFDPLESAATQLTKWLYCPYSQHAIEIPFMNQQGTGYLQQNFKTRCPHRKCENLPLITKEILAVKRLAEDLAYRGWTPPAKIRMRLRILSGGLAYLPHQDDWRPTAGLAGTLHNPDEPGPDIERSETVGAAAVKHPNFERPTGATEEEWTFSVMQKNEFSLEKMKRSMRKGMRSHDKKIINRIFSAYTDGGPFSVGLVGAVLRQGNFVRKMHKLHWTEPSFFDSKDDEVALQHVIARYHAFLDLMALSSRATFFVPTLDIDLAWHTHQLTSMAYGSDCRCYVGHFVDHHDKVEEAQLASAFESTCRAWKSRFGVSYTHCGCPIPGDTIGQKLLRLVVSYSASPLDLNTPDREDLTTAHPMSPFHKERGKAPMARRKEITKRQKRDIEVVTRGKHNSKAADRSEYDPAFLVPVLYYYYGPAAGGDVGTGGVATTSDIGGCSAVGIY